MKTNLYKIQVSSSFGLIKMKSIIVMLLEMALTITGISKNELVHPNYE